MTTDGAIAVGNLTAQIEGQEQILSRRPGSAGTMVALVELLQARVQFTSSVSDFRRIAELGDKIVTLEIAKGVNVRVERTQIAALSSYGKIAKKDAG